MSNSEYDFGFSFISDEELKATETQLQEQLASVTKTSEYYKAKIQTMKSMIMPLLIDLAKDPDKDIIRWAGTKRVASIQGFTAKLNAFVDDAVK